MVIERVRSRLKRNAEELRDASIFIVGTEGEHTERIYLSAFKSNKIKVVPVECDDGASSPDGVLRKVDEISKIFQFGDGDSFWLLVDKDAWTQKMFSDVYRECKKKGFMLCVSNHQFEIFLAHHFDDYDPLECSETKDIIKFLKIKLGGFSKSKYDASKLIGNAKLASDRCRIADTGKNEIWPDRPGSRAYLLVSDILSKA